LREFDADFREYTNSFLSAEFDDVSPDFSDGSILQAVNSGRDGAGGVMFTPCTDVNGTNYPLWISKQLTAQSTRIVQCYVDQDGNTQGTLGGRLLTLVDAPEDVFGATVQVAVNIMDDNTLQVTRATVAESGIILRGVDQAGDAQMTLLGTSTGTVGDASYLEIVVVHHPTTGSVTVWKDNVELWSLTGVNTAVSGRSQSTTFLLGGYAVTGDGDDILHHEDLSAIISDLMVINGTTNADDPNDPTARVGDHKPLLSTPEADGFYGEFTADPAGDHFANVNEIPPDGTSEVYASTTDLHDTYEMTDAAGTGTNQVYLTHRAYVKTDTPAECGVNGELANFAAFVFAEQDAPGSVIPTFLSSSPCNFTDFQNHRAQTICTISANGESVKFKPTVVDTSGFSVCLSPLDAPPRRCNQTFPGGQYVANFNSIRNMISVPSRVIYPLPFYQPWAGYALCTEIRGDNTGDFFQFEINGEGTSMEVGVVDHDYDVALDPYSPTLGAFHFREDLEGLQYFYVGENFSHDTEPTFTYAEGDIFTVTRTASTFEFRQSGVLRGTTTPGVMPLHAYAFTVAGRWGYRLGSYSVRPELRNALWVVAGQGCIICTFTDGCVVPETDANHMITDDETGQWGILFLGFEPTVALIADPGINRFDAVTPGFGWDETTEITFKLEGGLVKLEVRNWLYLDLMTNVGGVGTYTYTRPFSDTDDFILQPPFSTAPIGIPVSPFPSMEYAFVNGVANLPLRLVPLFQFDEESGINSVEFTFVEGQNPSQYAGLMRQDGADRVGSVTEAPTSAFAYRQSFQSSTPADTPITLDDANEAQHGPTDPL
jgi:hypothetical protein